MRLIMTALSIGILAMMLNAQSLNELSEKTKEKRRSEKPAKVYTNADLLSAKGSVSSYSSGSAAEPAKVEDTKTSQEALDTEYYDLLVLKYREVQSLEAQLLYAQLAFNEARNVYGKSSNGVYANEELRKRRNEAFDKVESLKKELEAARSKLNDLLEEARRKGVSAKTLRDAENDGTAKEPPSAQREKKPAPRPSTPPPASAQM